MFVGLRKIINFVLDSVCLFLESKEKVIYLIKTLEFHSMNKILKNLGLGFMSAFLSFNNI